MEKDASTTATDERTPFIERAKGSKFFAFCQKHKILVSVIVIMILLLPLLGLLALRNRGVRAAEWTSPIVYPSRTYWTAS